MIFQTKKHLAVILVGLSTTFFIASCGSETGEELDEVSDTATDINANLFGDRGKTPPAPPAPPASPVPLAPTVKDKKDPPPAAPRPESTKPVIQESEDDKKERRK